MSDPITALLQVGKPTSWRWPEWPDYRATFGLSDEHIPALIAMACDETLNDADEDSSEVWGPTHAWRALGQMRAADATEPLLRLLRRFPDDDVMTGELPEVFGMIGPPAIAPLRAFLESVPRETYVYSNVADGIKEVALRHPDRRAECIDILAGFLTDLGNANDELAGFIVSCLLDLRAVEAIGPIRDAFHRNAVDYDIAGDLEDIEIELGLRKSRTSPKPMNKLWTRLLGQATLPQAEPRATSAKVGRNDPCPCGSGKKYKKCCLV
jgi:hypothetical protein